MINKNLCHSLLLYFSQWHCSEQVVAQRNFNEFCWLYRLMTDDGYDRLMTDDGYDWKAGRIVENE